MTFYTAKGDDGTTGLLGEGRVPKYHVQMEAVGTLDEASAALGLARAQCEAPQTPRILIEAQRDLYKLMAEVASTPENAEAFRHIDDERVSSTVNSGEARAILTSRLSQARWGDGGGMQRGQRRRRSQGTCDFPTFPPHRPLQLVSEGMRQGNLSGFAPSGLDHSGPLVGRGPALPDPEMPWEERPSAGGAA